MANKFRTAFNKLALTGGGVILGLLKGTASQALVSDKSDEGDSGRTHYDVISGEYHAEKHPDGSYLDSMD